MSVDDTHVPRVDQVHDGTLDASRQLVRTLDGELATAPATGDALGERDEVGGEPGASELVRAVTKDLGELVGMHVELAKAEVREDVSQAIASGRDFGIGAFAAYVGVLMLSVTVALVLALWLPVWAGFAIVTALWFAFGAVMALRGKAHLGSIAIEQTVSTVREDVEWAQQQTS